MNPLTVILYPATRGFSFQVKATSTARPFYFNVRFVLIYRLLFSSLLWLWAWASLLGTAPCFSMQTHIKHTLFLRFQTHRIQSGHSILYIPVGQDGIPHYLLLWRRRSRLIGRFVW